MLQLPTSLFVAPKLNSFARPTASNRRQQLWIRRVCLSRADKRRSRILLRSRRLQEAMSVPFPSTLSCTASPLSLFPTPHDPLLALLSIQLLIDRRKGTKLTFSIDPGADGYDYDYASGRCININVDTFNWSVCRSIASSGGQRFETLVPR